MDKKLYSESSSDSPEESKGLERPDFVQIQQGSSYNRIVSQTSSSFQTSQSSDYDVEMSGSIQIHGLTYYDAVSAIHERAIASRSSIQPLESSRSLDVNSTSGSAHIEQPKDKMNAAGSKLGQFGGFPQEFQNEVVASRSDSYGTYIGQVESGIEDPITKDKNVLMHHILSSIPAQVSSIPEDLTSLEQEHQHIDESAGMEQPSKRKKKRKRIKKPKPADGLLSSISELLIPKKEVYFYILYGNLPETTLNISLQAIIEQPLSKPHLEDFKAFKLLIEIDSVSRLAVLWRYTLRFTDSSNLKLHFKLLDKKVRKQFDISNEIQLSTNIHNFILDLNIQSIRNWLFFTQKPSELCIRNPIQQLTSICFFIMSQPKCLNFIHDLVVQFVKYYDQVFVEFKRVYEEELDIFLKVIDCVVLQAQPHEKQDKSVFSLILLGMLASYDNRLFNQMNSNEEIMSILIGRYDTIVEFLEYDILRTYMQVGVVNQIHINLLVCKKNWLDLIERVHDQQILEALMMELAGLMNNQQYMIQLNEDESSRMVVLISRIHNKAQVRRMFLIQGYLKCKLVEYLAFIYDAFLKLQEESAEYTFILSDSDKDLLLNSMNSYLAQLLKLSDLVKILQFIYDKPITFKEIFYSSNLMHEVPTISSSYSNIYYALQHYTLIFRNFYDPILLSSLVPMNIALELISHNLEFYQVIEALLLDSNQVEEVFDAWLNNITLYEQSPLKLVERIDDQLAYFPDPDFLAFACQRTISKITEIGVSRRIDLLEYCYMFEKRKVLGLGTEYINMINTDIIIPMMQGSEEEKIRHLDRLFQISERFRGSSVCKTLKCNSLELLNVAISEEDIRRNLCENPSEKHYWWYILRDYADYSHIVSIDSILFSIVNYGNRIINQNITIEELLIIKNHSQIQARAFMTYIKSAYNIRRVFINQDFSIYLAQVIQALNDKLFSIEILQTFMQLICRDLKDLSILQYRVDQALSNYHLKPLISFDLSKYLGNLYSTAALIHPILNSRIFNNLLSIVKSQTEFNSNTVIQVCISAYDSLKNFMISVENFINESILDELVAFSLQKSKVDIELEILISSIDLKQLASGKFRDFLYYYNYRDDIYKYLTTIVEFNLFLPKFEPNIIEECNFFIQFSNTIGQTLKDFLVIADRVVQFLAIKFPLENEIKVCRVLQEYMKSDELLAFLSTLKEEEMAYLKEGVNDYDESFVDTQTILDLEFIWNLQHGILQQHHGYHDLISFIVQKIAEANQQTIQSQLSSCSSKLGAIKDLHINLNSRETAKKNQIIDICNQSTIEIHLTHAGYDILLHYPGFETKSCNLADLSELKDRASLILYTSHAKTEEDTEVDVISKFIDLVSCINNVISLLNELYHNGYPNPDRFMNSYDCVKGSFQMLKGFEYELSELSSCWERDLNQAYQRYYWLTYLHGRQIWALETYLSQQVRRSHEPAHLLNFMGKQLPQRFELIKNENDSILERLHKLGDMLHYLPSRDKKVYNFDYNISSESSISQKKEEILYLETSKLLNGIISLYLNSRRQFPRADQIFFCKTNTQFHELSAFLNRCFLNPAHELYVLINSENLSLEIQQKFIALFYQLYEKGLGDRQFQFSLVTASSDSLIGEYFKTYSGLNLIRLRDSQVISDADLTRIIRVVDSHSVVITSEFTGLGKTHFISQQALLQKRPIISMPIAGEITLEQVYIKLSSKQVPENGILYLSLNHVDNTYLLNEILINLTLFRSLYTTYGVICLPETCSLYIEIANSYQNSLIQSLSYLHHLNSYHIPEMSLQNIVVKKEKKDSIQFITSYLNLYDNSIIDSKEIRYQSGLNMQIHTPDTITTLLHKYFISRQIARNQSVNFTQLKIFTRILETLFKNFSKCDFFSPTNIGYMIREMKDELSFLIPEYSNIRSKIIESLLCTTEEFTTKCISNVRRMQTSALTHIRDIEAEEVLAHEFECNFSWDNSNHFIMIFLEDGSLLPIYRSIEDVPENIRKLIFLQNIKSYENREVLVEMLQNRTYQIEDYSSLTHIDLLRKFRTYGVSPDFVETHANGDYVLTPDNFLKMNLIYLRVMSSIPVVLMGETGCGKTSLVKFFASNVLKTSLEVINIHAGIDSAYIKAKMQELQQKAKKIPSSKKLWVFFDEFNTSDCIGLISEIMCEHSLEGEKLPNNMAFLGACNPYRLKLKKVCFEENVGIKKKQNNSFSRLMHIVKPLPDSVIEYVWDFGALQVNDARKYIETMLDRVDKKYLELFVNLICFAHGYFRDKEDASSVSLRDVRRFIILHEWFRKSILDKESLNKDNRYLSNAHNYQFDFRDRLEDIELRAGILALCHCYYLRISSQSERNSFLHHLCDSAGDTRLTPLLIQNVINYEQYDYILRMELPEGTALNKALKENIFAIIPCVLNKVPVFVCGKPGCSKSLAISLLFTNLRGEKSSDSYFRTLPELSMFSFQGSDSCTSDGISKVFERAKKYIENINLLKKNALPVVIFDEIGLAEISKHNPLKVLHSLLELDNRFVGFVGISNWRLDASKMNRAVYLARPDPDIDDLIYTAMSIYLSYSQGSDKYSRIIQDLAISYSQFKKCFKDNFQDTPNLDFYGLRDFYHMIKQVSKNLIELHYSNSYEEALIIQRSIERNFGGLKNAADIMGYIFSHQHNIQDIWPKLPKPSVLELINDNLRDENARYLMLITKSELGTLVLDKFLNIPIPNRRILVGSNLEHDLNHEEYGFRSLSDIILYAEKGISVIFKDMDHIYSSLYDLFNQKFALLGDRRYCRIALGALFNPRCFIHKDFHAIVFMNDDEKSISEADAPFLNRFEKHYFTLQDLLNDSQRMLISKLHEWISQIMTPALECDKIQIDPIHIFPIYGSEFLELLILYNYNREYNDEENLMRCKNILLQSASANIIVLSYFCKINKTEAEWIRETWFEIHRIEFRDLLHNYVSQPSSRLAGLRKVFIYTYDIEILGNTIHPDLDGFIVRKNFSVFKSEQDIRKDMQSFFQNRYTQVYLLEMDYAREAHHLSILKFLIDKLESETRHLWTCPKSIVVVVHLMRNIAYEPVHNLFEGWEYWSFNELLDKKFEINYEIFSLSTEEIISKEKFRTIEYFIQNLTEKCMLKLKYDPVIYKENKTSLNDHIFFIINNLVKDHELISLLKKKLLAVLRSKTLRIKDWRKQIFCNPEIILSSADLYTAILSSIEQQVESAFTIILYLLETECALKSFFTLNHKPSGQVIRQIWTNCFENITIQSLALSSQNQSNLAKIGIDLTFPFMKKDFKLISDVYKQYIQDKKNEKFDGMAEGIFESGFQKSSILRDVREEFDRLGELEEVYHRNIIRILLFNNLLSEKYEEFVYLLFMRMSQNARKLERRLLILLEYEKVFVLSINLIETYSHFIDHDPLHFFMYKLQEIADSKLAHAISDNNVYVNLALSRVKNSSNNFSSLDQDEKTESLNNISSTISFNPNPSNLPQDSIEAIQSEFLKDMEYVFESMIDTIAPTYTLLYKLSGSYQYYILIEKLYNLLLALQNDKDINIKNIESLQFWVSYTHLINKLELGQQNLIEVAGGNYSMKEASSLIWHNEFSDEIFAKLNAFPEYEKNMHILKFLSSYLSLLIKRNPSKLGVVAGYYARTELYKYASELIDSVIISSNISTQINSIHQSLQNHGADAHPNWECNQYMLIIDGILERYALDCPFSIQISDRLARYLEYIDTSTMNKDNILYLLDRIYPIFCYHSNTIIDEEDPLKNVKKLISIITLRKVYDIYSYILSFEVDLASADQDRYIEEFTTYLQESSYSPTLKLYCIKRIKQLKDLSEDEVLEMLEEKKNIYWKQDYMSTEVKWELDVFPIVPLVIDRYTEVSNKLKMLYSLKPKYDLLDLHIGNGTDPRERMAIGLAFQNIVFSRFLKQTMVDSNIAQWYEMKKGMMEQCLGRDFTALIRCFIYNFPQDSCLNLSPASSKNLNQIQTMCFTIIIILSHSLIESPITSIFFGHDGNAQPNFSDRMNRLFIVTAGSDPLLDDLRFKLENFEILKSRTFYTAYSKGGSYKCSNTCDYLYFIDNCGGAVVRSKCPYCGSDIGGENHRAIQRPGHDNLSDIEAQAYLKNTIAKRERESKCGYKVFNEDTPYVRELKPISYKLLRFILNSVLYFFKVSNIISFADMKSVLVVHQDDYEGVLSRSMMKDLEFLYKSLVSNESYTWVYHIIGSIPTLLLELQVNPTSFKIRNDFETKFESELIFPNLSEVSTVSTVIIEYNKVLDAVQPDQNSYKSVMKENKIPDSDGYEFIRHFRLIREPTFDNLINVFRLLNFKDSYSILDIYITNLDSFNKLKSLYPIVEFTNYLLREYDHKITREQARDITMNHLIHQDHELNKLYEKFIEAWENAELIELQYGCKVLKSIHFDGESKLNFFLVDNKEHGAGMYMAAALLYLAGLQNSILSQIVSSIAQSRKLESKYIMDPFEYPIQSINHTNILSSDLHNSLQLHNFALNDVNYGFGRDIFYDFDRLQSILIQDFLNAKFLDTSKLDLIQYQFELMNVSSNSSGIISEIRALLPQTPLDRENSGKLELFFNNLEKTGQEKYDIVMKDLYSSMNIILCYLKNARNVASESLYSFSSKIRSSKLSEYFREDNSITRLNLGNVVALYEGIEEKCFPHILECVKIEFKSNEIGEDVERGIEMMLKGIKENDKLPTTREVEKAVMRFIARYLTGDLEANRPIKMYLNNEDFWSYRVGGVLDDLMDLLPDNLNLSHSEILYRALNKYNSVQIPSKPHSQTAVRAAKIDSKKKPPIKSAASSIRKNIKLIR